MSWLANRASNRTSMPLAMPPARFWPKRQRGGRAMRSQHEANRVAAEPSPHHRFRLCNARVRGLQIGTILSTDPGVCGAASARGPCHPARQGGAGPLPRPARDPEGPHSNKSKNTEGKLAGRRNATLHLVCCWGLYGEASGESS